MKAIYLDHAATTPMHPDVVAAMLPVMENVYGNPSSVHHFGRQGRRIIDEARQAAAKSIKANEKEIVFTSGGTEADNLALIGTALANADKGKHIVTTQIEHHATLHAAQYLEKHGFSVTYLSVQENGQIDVDELKSVLREDTILVSVMFVNNETGIIQPVKAIGALLQDHQAFFHTDAVQAFGTVDIDVSELGIDLLTASSHKVNGPKGVGFLYIKNGVPVHALQYGGEQERKRRPGTENVAGIKGFHKAIELLSTEKDSRNERYNKYKQSFLNILKEEQITFSINGDADQAVAGVVNISFPGTNVEALLTNFDLSGVAASSGSACTAGSVEPSHVLSAMYGASDDRTVNSIRFSFGQANTDSDIEEAGRRVAKIVERLIG